MTVSQIIATLGILKSIKMFQHMRIQWLILLLILILTPEVKAQKQQNRPKIVIGVVVDQMRWDYLYRYMDRYEEGGFKRMLRDGFSCENMHINYSQTATGPGHACVYTGSVPAVHGIVGNTWYDRSIRKEINCVEDSLAQNVGIPNNGNSRSPRNLLTTTIGDELKLSNNHRSKVISVSLKDRGAILPGGHLSDGSYWYDGGSGNFITSTFYMNELPEWVQRFNDQKLPEKYLKESWTPLYSIDSYHQSTEDNKPYEKTVAGDKPVFPFDFDPSSYGKVRNTPYGNMLVFDMARAAIEGENLGSGDFTDMLAMSFSATDGLGHGVGPNAVEIEDMYLRLDQGFAKFFKYLDERFGENEYLFFITADHGAAHSAGFLKEKNLPSGVYNLGFIKEIVPHIKEKYGIDQVIESAQNAELYLNWDAIHSADKNIDEEELIDEILRFILKQDGIANVWNTRKLEDAPWPDEIKNRYINGYNQARGGDIVIMPQPGWQASEKGTNHGLWYPFDAHIPLVWMGWNIPQGQTHRFVGMTDIAPTIAAMLKIQMPSGSIGTPIQELTK